MATAVLGIVGNLIFPGIGGAIGAAVGAGVDLVIGSIAARSLLGDVSTPPPDQRKHPTADEGTPAPWIFGPFNRVTGQVIYLSNIRNVPISGDQKGKSPQTTVWNYKCDVAIAWARTECSVPPVKRIWASGELIFQEEVTFVINEGAVRMIPQTKWDAFPGIDTPMPVGNFWCEPSQNPNQRRSVESQLMTWATVIGTTEDDDWHTLRGQMSGVDVTISGATFNNGTFKCTSFRYFQPTDPTMSGWEMRVKRCEYSYPTNPPVPEDVCVPNGVPGCTEAVDVPGTAATFTFTISGFSLYFDDIRHYNGSGSQAVDPIIRDDPRNGAAVTPAFRGTCYTVIENLDITKWASTLPQFEAEVAATEEGTETVKTAFEAVIARNEATTSYRVDTSLVNDLTPVLGMQMLGPASPSSMLRSLMQTYDVEAQERLVQVGWDQTPVPVLFFVSRDQLAVKQLDYDLTSARQSGDEGRVHATIKRSTTDTLPQEFVVDYIEFERDLQPGTTSYSIATGAVRNTQKMALPTVQTQPGADVLARLLLWKAINFHDRVEFGLTVKEYGITEGDRLQLNTPSDGLPIEARVARVDIGENGLMELDCQIAEDLAFEQVGNEGYSDPDDTSVPVPELGELIVLDMAPIAAADASTFGLYFANQITTLSGSINYTIFTSIDQVNWQQPAIIQSAAIAGWALTVLPAPTNAHFWDMTSTVDVYLESDQVLESISQEEVENGMNWAYLGREIIGFMTATPLGADDPFRYTLSGLLRGRNDSEMHMGGHFINETFVMLPPTSPAVAFAALEPSLYLQTVFATVVPTGRPVTDGTIVTVVPSAETLRPFTLHGAWGVRTPDGTTCVYATPSTRVPFRLLSGLVPPMVESGPVTDYTADVYWLSTPTTWTFARTIEACSVANGQIAFEYSAADQVTDLVDTGLIPTIDPTLDMRFVMRRVSDTIGPGREIEFCIGAVGADFDDDCSLP